MATMISMSDLSRGIILELDDSLWVILNYQNFKTGKGNSEARMRIKLRDIRTGYTQDRTFRTDERVTKAAVENRQGQFLYNDSDLYHFTDMETYEEKILSGETLGDTKHYLLDGMDVELVMYKEQPLSVELPIIVQLRITETEPGFKGDTATAGTKKAITETGLSVDVPMFLNNGDFIKVDTRTGDYVSRA